MPRPTATRRSSRGVVTVLAAVGLVTAVQDTAGAPGRLWFEPIEPPPAVSSAPPTQPRFEIRLDPESDNVGPALQEQLQALPDGATAVLPSGRFRLEDHTVRVSGHTGLTIEGNGAVFTSERKPTARGRRVFEFTLQSDLVLRGFTYEGPNGAAGAAGSFEAEYEGAHGLAIVGSRDVVIENVTIGDTYGDGLLIRNHGQTGTRSTGVTVRHLHVRSAGRQGVAVTDGSDVLIERSILERATLKNLDIEPEAGQRVDGVTFRFNEVGESGSFAWGANTRDGTIRDLRFHDNVMHSLAWGFPGDDRSDRAGFVIVDNVGLNVRTSIVSARGRVVPVETLLPLAQVSDATVEGNDQPLVAGQQLTDLPTS